MKNISKSEELYKMKRNADTVEIECANGYSWFKFTGWAADSDDWKNGTVIQNALPYLHQLGESTANMPTYDVLMAQELLVNQLCDECRGKI